MQGQQRPLAVQHAQVISNAVAVPLAVGANSQILLKGMYDNKPATLALKSGTISTFVGGQPHENRQQFVVLNYIIAWSGVFPSQG